MKIVKPIIQQPYIPKEVDKLSDETKMPKIDSNMSPVTIVGDSIKKKGEEVSYKKYK